MTPQVRFGEWISEGWDRYRAQWATWTVMMFFFVIPVVGVYVMMQMIAYKIRPRPADVNILQYFMDTFTESMALNIFTSLLVAMVSAFFVGGFFRTAFKQLQGEEISPQDALSGIDIYLNVLATLLLTGVISFAAQLLCFFPVFIASGLMMFTMPIVVREGLSPLEALRKSFEMTKSQWLIFTLFAFVMQLLSFIGIFGCLVGIIFTYPLFFIISAVAYRDCFEPSEKAPSRVDELYTKACVQCGKSLDVRASFCDKCGASQV